MNRSPWMEDFQKNIADLIAKSPAADLERNVKSMMTQAFTKMDLVTREEFDIQADMLARLRVRVDQLAAQVAALQGGVGSSGRTAGGHATPGHSPTGNAASGGSTAAGHAPGRGDAFADRSPMPASSFDPGAAAPAEGSGTAAQSPAQHAAPGAAASSSPVGKPPSSVA